MKHAIDEYKAQRDAIMGFYQRRASVQNTGVVIFAGLQSVAFLGKVPELSVAATLIMIAFYKDDIVWTYDMTKIGAYIREILEPHLEGVRWQTLLAICDPTQQVDSKWTIRRLVSRYPMTIIMSILLGIFLAILQFTSGHPGRSLINLILLGEAFLLFCWVIPQEGQYAKKHKEWRDKFRQALEKTDSPANAISRTSDA